MHFYRLTLLVVILIAATGCDKKKEAVATNAEYGGSSYSEIDVVSASASPSQSNPAMQYLAYLHRISLKLDENELTQTHATIVSECQTKSEFQCVVLQASLDSNYTYDSSIRLRLKPEGVPHFKELLQRQGEVVSHSTTAEDLGDRIVDTQKRIEMLESYQVKLKQLEEKADADVDALIKVASELAKTQNELEFAQGRRATLLQRVQTDILEISMRAPDNNSTGAIATAFDDFGDDLSYGIAAVITAAAYLLPWTVFLIVCFLLLRVLWRLLRRKKA